MTSCTQTSSSLHIVLDFGLGWSLCCPRSLPFDTQMQNVPSETQSKSQTHACGRSGGVRLIESM